MMICLRPLAIEDFLDLPPAGKRGPLTLFSHRCRIVCKTMSRMIVADIKFSYRIHIQDVYDDLPAVLEEGIRLGNSIAYQGAPLLHFHTGAVQSFFILIADTNIYYLDNIQCVYDYFPASREKRTTLVTSKSYQKSTFDSFEVFIWVLHREEG